MTENTSKQEKTSKVKSELMEAKKIAEERLNQLKYLQADFDNYRKQFEKERLAIIKLSNENLIKELLSILDSFDNALINNNDQGLQLLYNDLMRILELNGLKAIKSLGQQFDPDLHEVINIEHSKNQEGLILEEYQKGYMLNDKVIRPSKVKITKHIVQEKQDGEREDNRN